jgi:crossover junction endodeoxyribonuclease RusA
VIELPWPPRELSPNARPHFMARARAAKAYRMTAHWATKATYVPPHGDTGDIALRITFYPPSRRIDRQNMPGWIKAGVDGIADALGVNDKRFDPQYEYADPVKGGRIEVVVG